MTEFLFAVYRRIEVVTRLFGYVGAGIVLVLIAAMDYEVLMRYVFHDPTLWAYEVGYFLMAASFLFTIGFAMIMRSHIRVDFLYGRLSPKKKAAIDFIGYLFFLFPIVTWTTYGLWNYFLGALVSGERSGESAWNPVIWPFRIILVVGFALFTIQIVAEIFKCVLVLKGEHVPEPKKGSVDMEH